MIPRAPYAIPDFGLYFACFLVFRDAYVAIMANEVAYVFMLLGAAWLFIGLALPQGRRSALIAFSAISCVVMAGSFSLREGSILYWPFGCHGARFSFGIAAICMFWLHEKLPAHRSLHLASGLTALSALFFCSPDLILWRAVYSVLCGHIAADHTTIQRGWAISNFHHPEYDCGLVVILARWIVHPARKYLHRF